MKITDRVKELRRVRASDLKPHPVNWRTHPPEQQNALRGVLAEVGFAGALLARELDDGSLQLVDGHLRAEIVPDAEVPVLVVDLTETEAAKLLLAHDPIGAMAGVSHEALTELLSKVDTKSKALRDVFDDLARRSCGAIGELDSRDLPEVQIPESYQVVVECEGETQQQQVYERMRSEGFRCRVLTL